MLLAGLALTLAACDSVETPSPSPLASFVVTGAQNEVEVERTDTLRLALPQFSLPGGATPPTTVTVAAENGIEATRDGDSLSVRALTAGVGHIAITARASGVRDTTVTVAVRVVETCPAAGPVGARDYFPSVDGDRWTLDVESSTGGAWMAQSPLTVTLNIDGCARGTRSGELRYEADGGGIIGIVPFSESPEHMIRFGTPDYVGSGFNVVFPRYAVDGPETLEIPIACSSGPSMDFRDGVGFVSESYYCRGPAQSLSGRRLTRPL